MIKRLRTTMRNERLKGIPQTPWKRANSTELKGTPLQNLGTTSIPSPQPQVVLPEILFFRISDIAVQQPPLAEKLPLRCSQSLTRPYRNSRRLSPLNQIQRLTHPPKLLIATKTPCVLAIQVSQNAQPHVSPKPGYTKVDPKPIPSQSQGFFDQTALLDVVGKAPETAVVVISHLAGAVAGLSSPGHAHRTLLFVELMGRARAAALHLPPVFDAFLEKEVSTVQLAEFVLQRWR